MTLSRLIKKPLIAAVLGASMIGVPVGTLYFAGATRALATQAPAAVTAQVSPAAAPGIPTVTLPDFCTMLLKSGSVTPGMPAAGAGDTCAVTAAGGCVASARVAPAK